MSFYLARNLTTAFWAFFGVLIVVLPCLFCVLGMAALVTLVGLQAMPGVGAQMGAQQQAAAAAAQARNQ
jgi:hypothetical protein